MTAIKISQWPLNRVTLSDVMTQTEASQAAVSHNYKYTEQEKQTGRDRVPCLFLENFPEELNSLIAQGVLYIYAPPSLLLSLFPSPVCLLPGAVSYI